MFLNEWLLFKSLIWGYFASSLSPFVLEQLLVLGVAVLVLIEEDGDEHLESGLVGEVHRSHASSDLTRLNVVSPLELAAGFCRDKVQLAWEPGLLDEQQDSIVDVFSEQLLECCPVVGGLLLL